MWDDLNLKLPLLRGIYGAGFEQPSPIQEKAIPIICKGGDVIAQAQSGTGKTASFCISVLQNCTPDPELQGLILAPTRELAEQINDVFNLLNVHTGIKSYLLIGGSPVDKDIYYIQQNKPQVFIGCPGRVLDIISRTIVSPRSIKMIVLDEADEMLSQGFKDQVYNIFNKLNDDIQVVLFSATFPEILEETTKKFMRNPTEILVKSDMLTLEGISQFYISFNTDRDKIEALQDLYKGISVSQSIIYCNSVKRVVDLYDIMKKAGFPVCCIHSEMDKVERNINYKEFKQGKYRVLISSNITARGIDIQQVSIVINFDIPKCVHTYLHRIGRSGRWGRKGVAINFVTKYDDDKMKMIQDHYSIQIKEFPSNFSELLK
jgi:translation initiation factor 4A